MIRLRSKNAVPRELRLKVLAFMEENGDDQQLAAKHLQIPVATVGKVVAWDKYRKTKPHKEAALKERALRDRLYERAVKAVERGLTDPKKLIQDFIESDLCPTIHEGASPNEQRKALENARDLLGIYMSALGNQARTATKVLEGVTDGLVKQGEVKHTGTVEVQQKVAVIMSLLEAGRKRVAADRQLGDGSTVEGQVVEVASTS